MKKAITLLVIAGFISLCAFKPANAPVQSPHADTTAPIVTRDSITPYYLFSESEVHTLEKLLYQSVLFIDGRSFAAKDVTDLIGSIEKKRIVVQLADSIKKKK